MKIAITIIFIVVSLALMIVVLMQEGKDNSAANALSGSTESYWNKNKGKSRDVILVRVTSVLIALFFIFAALLSSKWM